jgi:hypothetical protein
MINKALQFLKDQLSSVLNQPGNPENLLLTSVVNEKGELNIEAGQMAMMLVNIEEEKILKAQLPRDRRTGDQIQFANPEIKLNLLVMLAASPGTDNYLAALERLSLAMLFFQGTSFFDRTRFPALAASPEIEQLSVELYSLSLEQQNQLWASLGAKYLPSALYKVRLVIIDRGLFGQNVPAIKVLDNKLKKIN